MRCGKATFSTPLVPTLTLNESAIEVKVKESKQLEAIVEPEEVADKSVTWSSSDETIATVDENGVVTGVAIGEATITATLNADPSISATCAVTVIKSGLKGDVNGDGSVNIADVNEVIDMILSGRYDAIGDVNGDGSVNIGDINALIAIILK